MILVPNYKQLVESSKAQYREYSLLRNARESGESIRKICQINVAEICVKIGQQTAILTFSISKFIIILNFEIQMKQKNNTVF